MLKKIKKRFSYLLGAVLALVFSRISFAQNTDLLLPPPDIDIRDIPVTYGIPSFYNDMTLWEKILNIIFSPIFFAIIIVLALIIGLIIYFKKKKKNAKKDEKTV